MASSSRSRHASSERISSSEDTVPTRNLGLSKGSRTCCRTCAPTANVERIALVLDLKPRSRKNISFFYYWESDHGSDPGVEYPATRELLPTLAVSQSMTQIHLYDY